MYANIGSNEVPHAIKYLFDLLDSEAAENSIHDPNIVHVWKCNRCVCMCVCVCVCVGVCVCVCACVRMDLQVQLHSMH